MKSLFFYLIALILIVSFNSNAQTTFGLDHQMRKYNTDTLIFPCQKFNPQSFDVKFPDSIYSKSQVTVIKLKIQDVRKIKFELQSEDRKIQSVKYVIKGKRRFNKFQKLVIESFNLDVDQLNQKTIIEKENCTIQISKRVIGRSHTVSMELES